MVKWDSFQLMYVNLYLSPLLPSFIFILCCAYTLLPSVIPFLLPTALVTFVFQAFGVGLWCPIFQEIAHQPSPSFYLVPCCGSPVYLQQGIFLDLAAAYCNISPQEEKLKSYLPVTQNVTLPGNKVLTGVISSGKIKLEERWLVPLITKRKSEQRPQKHEENIMAESKVMQQ